MTGNPEAASMHCTSASTLGRSYTLYYEGVVCICDVWCIRNSSDGFRLKHPSLDSSFSIQTVRIDLPLGDKTVTSCLVNTTLQFASHMGPTPTSVLVKEKMMYTVVGNYDANCGIGSVAVADDLSICTFAVPTLIFEALVVGGPYGYDGAMYWCVALEYTMPVSF